MCTLCRRARSSIGSVAAIVCPRSAFRESCVVQGIRRSSTLEVPMPSVPPRPSRTRPNAPSAVPRASPCARGALFGLRPRRCRSRRCRPGPCRRSLMRPRISRAGGSRRRRASPAGARARDGSHCAVMRINRSLRCRDLPLVCLYHSIAGVNKRVGKPPHPLHDAGRQSAV